MQIIIDIDDKVYGLLKYFETSLGLNDKKDNNDDVKTALMRAVINGTPLSSSEKPNKSEIPTGWIPVNERLPEDNTKVLVTIDATYKEKVLITWYQDKKHGFLCGLVKAWMPLPEKYTEGGEQNE